MVLYLQPRFHMCANEASHTHLLLLRPGSQQWVGNPWSTVYVTISTWFKPQKHNASLHRTSHIAVIVLPIFYNLTLFRMPSGITKIQEISITCGHFIEGSGYQKKCQ